MKLLEQLIDISSPAGDERAMRDFIISYVKSHQDSWKSKPELLYGDGFMDNLILVFGKPRSAIFAHMDTTGFTVRYQDQLVPIGGPDTQTGYELVGRDAMGFIQCQLREDESSNQLFYDFPRAIETGTNLTWKPSLSIKNEMIKGTYLDNRLGLYNALCVAEDLQDGVIVFSTYEEHGGGSVPFLTRYIYEKFNIGQALISDITWVTEGVIHGEGVAISLRDKNIPRKAFLERILLLADKSGIQYQLEVEGGGSSDGREVHHSPYPIDWVFIGAPEDHVHSPQETVHAGDLIAMTSLYKYLMKEL